MAVYEGKQAREYVSPLTGDAGNCFCCYGFIDVATSMGAGDVLKVVNVPRGARIIRVFVVADANTGAGGEVRLVGAGQTIGNVSGIGTSAQEVIPAGEVVCSEDDCVAIVLGGAPTGAGKVKVGVFYTLTNVG